MRRAVLAAAALALALASCAPDEGPLMRPGEDCLACHAPGGARAWSMAGTVFSTTDAPTDAGVLNAHVQVTDAGGRGFTLRTNEAGNFYSAEALAFPLAVCIERGGAVACMQAPVQDGSCNRCHTLPPQGNAPGRIAPP